MSRKGFLWPAPSKHTSQLPPPAASRAVSRSPARAVGTAVAPALRVASAQWRRWRPARCVITRTAHEARMRRPLPSPLRCLRSGRVQAPIARRRRSRARQRARENYPGFRRPCALLPVVRVAVGGARRLRAAAAAAAVARAKRGTRMPTSRSRPAIASRSRIVYHGLMDAEQLDRRRRTARVLVGRCTAAASHARGRAASSPPQLRAVAVAS